MDDMSEAEPVRGVVTTTRWTGRCKDCGRVGGAAEFTYPDTWIEGVLERGGTRSDRCPACRQQHARDVRSMAVPYIDLDVIGVVANRAEPSGRLGGLGPLPIEHIAVQVDNDLARYDFGINDDDVRRLMGALEMKQVAVVVAGTGSGKSTFLPYRLMEPPAGAGTGLASRGPIIVTEPRRAAAVDTAKFVAEGLHGAPKVGAGCDIGYRVKGENAYDSSCRLIYVTDGSLINWIREGQLDKFGAVIIDEAHERNKNIDIILAVLRAQRQRYPRLKVLIASATIDGDFFVEYFGGEKEVVRLPVEAEKRFGYGEPLWPCEDVDLAHSDWRSGELHRIPLREYARQLTELRVVENPVAQGRNFQVWREQMPALVVKQAVALHRGTSEGDILGFLPTENAIKEAVGKLEDALGDEVDVFGLMRSACEKHQLAARAPRRPDAPRRIIVATNIAETSLTIDGISFVIDSGLICQSRWDADTASKNMPSLAHSQDGVKQRWGRVGRKAPGFVFPLYTREQFDEFIEHTPAEAVRDDLEGFMLTSTAIGVEGLDGVVYPAEFQRPGEDPDPLASTFSKELERAKRAMMQRGALDSDGDVTQMGAELMAFQGTMGEAGAIIGSDELCCSVETAVVLSLLMGRQPIGTFLRFQRKWDAPIRAAVRRLHEATYAGCRDDLDVALKVYAGWESAPDPAAWAARHYVSHELMLKAQIGRAERLEFLSAGRSSPVTQLVRTQLADRVRAVLARSLVDFTYVRDEGRWRPLTGDDGISYELDSLVHPPRADRVIALRRRPGGQPKTAYLGTLVQAPEWAARCIDWTELAVEAATRLRDDDGEVVGVDAAEHWAFDDAWPVGLHVRAHVETDGRLRADETLLAPRTLRLPEDDEDEVDAEEALLEEEPADDGGNEAMQERDDVAALISETDVIVAEEPDECFVDLRDEEDNDVKDGATEADIAVAPLPPLPADSVRASRIDNRALDAGVYRVVGYSGAGAAREVVLVREPEHPELQQLVAEGVAPGSPLPCTCVEVVSDWGPTFACVREPRTGYELHLGAEDLTFSQHDRGIASCIPLGAEFPVLVTELDVSSQTMRGTRLPLVQRHFNMVEPVVVEEGGQRRMMRPATVLAERWGGWVALQLNHGEPDTGMLHRYSAREQAFSSLDIGALAGLPILVELVPSAGLDADGWVSKRLTKVPDGIDGLCEEQFLRFDLNALTLYAAQGMTAGLRDRLSALSDDVHWKRAMTNLWRDANTRVVSAVAASEATASAVDEFRALYMTDSEHEGTVTGFNDNGVFVRSGDHGWDGMAHRSKIGADGVLDPLSLLRLGQVVSVRVLGLKETKRGTRLELALPDLHGTSLSEQVRSLVGANPVGTVLSLTERGAALRLSDTQLSGWLPSNALGTGVLDISTCLNEGDELAVTVVSARFGDRGRLEILLGAHGFAAASLLAQAQEFFAAHAIVRGRTAGLMPFGRLIRLPYNLRGAIAWRTVDYTERSWLEALGEGEELDVSVLSVRDGNGPRGMQIDLDLPRS